MIDGLRDGTRTVVREFCDRYGKSLERLAEKHLTGGMRRRVGAEDVVQSACRTFLRRAQIGEFELADAQGLWGLLCAITLTKVREQKRYHLRQKRGLDREVHPADVSPGNGARLFDRADSEPTPAEAAEFADQFTQLVAGLDDEERQLVDLKLQQCTNEEIAERMGCSERTVRRILKRVQSALTRQLERD
jgi:RNA polymerase sigma-70 factor (ECF subfamily)